MTTTVNGGHRAALVQARRVRAARAAAVIEELIAQRSALVWPATNAPVGEHRDAELRWALISARLAGWWRVLARTSFGEVPEVFVCAASTARQTERERAVRGLARARSWAEVAAVRAGESGSGSVR